MDRAVHAGLHSQASRMHSSKKSHIQSLFNRLEEIHHQMVSDVIASEREIIFIICPAAFHQLWLESFVFEKSLLVRGINRRLAGQTDKPDLDVFRIDHLGSGFLAAAAQKQRAETERHNTEFRTYHFH